MEFVRIDNITHIHLRFVSCVCVRVSKVCTMMVYQLHLHLYLFQNRTPMTTAVTMPPVARSSRIITTATITPVLSGPAFAVTGPTYIVKVI